ncbi:hypothetical protein PQX77_005344 [Marasmius sp. AFHP31]|nr:hypothetical protein PQX77_005344 [Marasmius sp. AFHP31]
MIILDVETSVEAAKEVSSASSDSGSVVMKVLILSVVFVAIGVGAKRWLYPFTIEDADCEIRSIFGLLQEYTSLKLDLLGDSAGRFRRRLDKEYSTIHEIKHRSMVEPDRRNFIAWLVFRWQEIRDVKRCYLSLMILKKDITAQDGSGETQKTLELDTNTFAVTGARYPDGLIV